MKYEQFDRQMRFFGKEGQDILQNTHVCIVGVGGIGSHLVQQLAYLGVGLFSLIDSDNFETTNLNRLIGAHHDDPMDTPKVNIMERLILSINPDIKVNKIHENLISISGFQAVKQADFVFGCIDNDGARLVLNELCLAYEIPYIDTATEIFPKTSDYGGSVVSITDGNRCLCCLGLISSDEARRYLENPDARKDEEAIYGVSKEWLEDSGPAVVTINGIIASIAATEFLLHITGIRKAKPFLSYNGRRGIVNLNTDEPREDCYFCKMIRRKRDDANVENKYIPDQKI